MKYLFASAPIDEELIRQEISSQVNGQGLNLDTMREIHREHGVDHSSTYVREALQNCEKNNAFIEDIENCGTIKSPNFEFVIIPGMFYRQHPEVGGDGTIFKIIADRLNIPCSIIPLESLGSISENAAILADFFEKSDKSVPKWILSMSKGTADLKRALTDKLSGDALESIRGILNVSGVHGGTRLTASRKGNRCGHLLMKSWMKFRGANISLLKEMHTDHEYSRSEYSLPSHMEVVNIFGLPLLSHLRKPLIKTYRYLMEFGPNDGYVLTEDALIPSEKNILFWGADHYLRTPELNVRIEQLIRWINKREKDR